MPKLRNVSGQRFGRLLVVELLPVRRDGRALFRCHCDCGATAIALGKTLLSGGTRSCGCLKHDVCLQKVAHRTRPIGFERTTAKGYVEVKTDSGFRRKHVHVMEMHLGRRLGADECVHHCDQDKTNNALDNLQLMSHADHTILHNQERGPYGIR